MKLCYEHWEETVMSSFFDDKKRNLFVANDRGNHLPFIRLFQGSALVSSKGLLAHLQTTRSDLRRNAAPEANKLLPLESVGFHVLHDSL